MSPTLIVGVAALAVGLGGGYYLRDLQADAKELAEAKEKVVLTEKQQLHVSEGAEASVKKEVEIRTKYVYIKEKARELEKTDFYAPGNLCLDDDGLRLLSEAGAATEAGGQPENSVRDTEAPEGR